MSEHQAPYLHIVRSSDATASEGADGAESADEGNVSPDEGQATLASSDVASGPSTLAALPEPPQPSARQPSQALAQAIMYAAVSWVALCVERPTFAVDIQPIAPRLYEVSIHYADDQGQDSGEGVILRVTMAIDPGLVIRTTVEPVKP